MKTAMKSHLTQQEMENIAQILVDQLHIDPAQIKPEADLMGDLGADSLDLVEIAMRTEEAFGVSMPDEATEKIRTVGDLWETAGRLLHGSP